MEKDLNYWKKNAEEDYMKVPISVLRYITELEKVVLPRADVISSIELLKNDMESWKETLIENAKDNEKYSEGLLKGYNAAIGQFQNRMGKYCL